MDKIDTLQKKIDDLKRKAVTFQAEIANHQQRIDALREKISGDLLADRDTARDESELNKLTNHQSVLSGAVVKAGEEVKRYQDDIFALKVEADLEKIRALDLAGDDLVSGAVEHLTALYALTQAAQAAHDEMRELKHNHPAAGRVWQESKIVRLTGGLMPLGALILSVNNSVPGIIEPELIKKIRG